MTPAELDTGPPGPQNDCAPGGETEGGTKSVNGGEPIDKALPPPPKDVNGNSFALRPYQREAIEATIKGFDEFRRQLIVCPTGGGKTLLFAKIAEHYQPGPHSCPCPSRGTPRTGARQDSAGNRHRGRDRGSRTHCQP